MDEYSLNDILFFSDISYINNNHIFLNEYYTDSQIERQKYDLVIPKNAKGDLGLVLCIHGGGWTEGSKDSYTHSLFQVCIEKGVAAACMNYRYLSENISFDNILDDITFALDSIKQKAACYGINITKVLFTGISAGAHLSMLYGYSKKNISPVLPVCIVELCGPTDFEDMFYFTEGSLVGPEYFAKILSFGIGKKIDINNIDKTRNELKKYSPINYIDNNTIPTFFGQGDNDNVVPYGNSVELDKKLSEYNINHEFITFPDSTHECQDKKSMTQIMKIFFECIDTYLK